MSDPALESAWQTALRLLGQRDHSCRDLANKLSQRGVAKTIVQQVLEQLVKRDLLNDDRFAEHYIAHRMEQGFGPFKIRFELRRYGIDEEQIASWLPTEDDTWQTILQQAQQKRFGALPTDRQEQARQARFLESRGFSRAQIRQLLWQRRC